MEVANTTNMEQATTIRIMAEDRSTSANIRRLESHGTTPRKDRTPARNGRRVTVSNKKHEHYGKKGWMKGGGWVELDDGGSIQIKKKDLQDCDD